METIALCLSLFLAFSGPALKAQGNDEQTSRVERTPEWDEITGLSGEWEGYALHGTQRLPTHISIRITGDGSAVMHWMDAGTSHEMVTMFHMDRSNLLATHYCAAHNQPRLQARTSQKPNELAFEFKDGTNIRPGDGFMRSLVITFVDPDHHNETWGYDSNGKVSESSFFLTRVKK